MRADFTEEAVLDLVAGGLCVLSGLAGAALLCEQGQFWLTEEGLAADIVLGVGEAYSVRGAGKLLIESGGQARLRCIPARQTVVAGGGLRTLAA